MSETVSPHTVTEQKALKREEKKAQNNKLVLIHGNEQLSKLFEQAGDYSQELLGVLTGLLEENQWWNEYFEKGGIAKNKETVGLRLKSNVTYPYTGELGLSTGHTLDAVKITSLEEMISLISQDGVDFEGSSVIWLSYRDPNSKVSLLQDKDDTNSVGNLGSVTEYAFGKGPDAYENYVRPNFLLISLYDITKLKQNGSRMDAFIPKDKDTTFKDAHLVSFVITVPN
jgi:hypothetical protein